MIGDRVKELRKMHLKLSMEEFGERIGVGRTTISMIESSRNNPSTVTVKAICREFNVNYDWLVNGEGEMFIDPDDVDTVDDLYFTKYGITDPVEITFIKALCKLPEDVREAVKKQIVEEVNSACSEKKT